MLKMAPRLLRKGKRLLDARRASQWPRTRDIWLRTRALATNRGFPMGGGRGFLRSARVSWVRKAFLAVRKRGLPHRVRERRPMAQDPDPGLASAHPIARFTSFAASTAGKMDADNTKSSAHSRPFIANV